MCSGFFGLNTSTDGGAMYRALESLRRNRLNVCACVWRRRGKRSVCITSACVKVEMPIRIQVSGQLGM